jgi:hypothetical protein
VPPRIRAAANLQCFDCDLSSGASGVSKFGDSSTRCWACQKGRRKLVQVDASDGSAWLIALADEEALFSKIVPFVAVRSSCTSSFWGPLLAAALRMHAPEVIASQQSQGVCVVAC